MHTDRAITRPSSESVSMRPIVDRQTPVKTLPSLAVGNNSHSTENYVWLDLDLLGINRSSTIFRVTLITCIILNRNYVGLIQKVGDTLPPQMKDQKIYVYCLVASSHNFITTNKPCDK